MMTCASPMASTVPLSLPIIVFSPPSQRLQRAGARRPRSWGALPRAPEGARRAPRGRAVAGVAHRDRERVGLIGALELGPRQQKSDHGGNLPLLAVAGAGDRLLDDVGGILCHPQA